MKETIDSRFKELMQQGTIFSVNLGEDDWVEGNRIPLYQSWLSSATNLIQIVAPKQSYHYTEADRLMKHDQLSHGIPSIVFNRMLGLLNSAHSEWDKGILREMEFIVAAETFDDFLDHASIYHKGGKKVESAILASSVLEDTIKKIANRSNLQTKGISLDPLIEQLITSNVFNTVKGKRIKAYVGIRNKAMHAEWDEFDIKDVGEMIKGLRELIENYLT